MAEKIVTLSAEMVKKFLNMEQLILLVEQGLANFSKGPEGGVVQPVRSVVAVDKPDGTDGQG